MPEPHATTEMTLDLSPDQLRLEEQAVLDAVREARQKSGETPETFGYLLWVALLERGACFPALDQTVDRLPATAFGRVPPNSHIAATMRMWSVYGAPSEAEACVAFKEAALRLGWKPSQTNSFLVRVRQMERMMFGDALIPDTPADFSQLDLTGLNARERAVIEDLQSRPAFTEG